MKNTTHEFPLITNHSFDNTESGLPETLRHSFIDFFNTGAIVLVDKPAGWTSFDVVNKIRNITKAKKVGHCGTLDPFATGLLIVCTGKATKIVDEFAGLSKIYFNEFELGKTTDTLDCDGEVVTECEVGEYSIENLRQAALTFTGDIEQEPPAYSAIKVNGVAAYKLARKGKTPELKPRNVHIESFEILDYNKPILQTRIHCSKGTYIRSIARDFGHKLRCGAYVKTLRRESIGSFTCADALSINQFADTITSLKTTDVNTN